MINIILCRTSLALPISVQAYSSAIVQFINSSGLWCKKYFTYHSVLFNYEYITDRI